MNCMQNPVIIPVTGKSNVRIVVEQLEQLIDSGYWEPETRIWSEAELCAQFNVGRSTVREAINMLKAKNMVYIVPGLGTFVSKPSEVDSNFVVTHIPDPKSEADLLNIMELRLGLEPVNAALAAKRASAGELEALRQSLEERKHLNAGSADDFARNDMEFHMRVARAAHNAVTLGVMDMVVNFLMAQQILTSHQTSRRLKAANFHEQIASAIAARQGTLAETVMREHMEETYENVLSLISISKRVSGRLPAHIGGK